MNKVIDELMQKIWEFALEVDRNGYMHVDAQEDILKSEVHKILTELRNSVLDEAADKCESLFDPDDDSCNEAETCAKEIRSMKT